MGNPKVLFYADNLETINFDKLVRATLEIPVQGLDPETAEVVLLIGGGLHTILPASEPGDICILIDGDESDREYWKRGGRSMTELYAIRTGLGTADSAGTVLVESPIVGLVALCRSLAENHGKVPGVKGGSLYKPGMIPGYARRLSLLPDRAPEIIGKLVKAVAASLKDAHPIPAMIAMAGAEWDEIDDALASADRAVYAKARDAARALSEGRYANGRTFPLAKASGAYLAQGVAIETRDSNLMKHLWAAMKAMEPNFRVAAAVVSHPDTKRVAVLCSQQYDVDIRPVAKELKALFHEADIDVNVERNSIVWDPRSKTTGPTPAQVAEIVSAKLAFRKEEKKVQGPRFGATLASRFSQKPQQKRR